MENRNLQIVKKADILGKILSIYGDSENPLFLAKDIADWIEHTNVTEMVRNLEDGTEKLNSTILSAGQNREMTLLTEDGVYEVLMTSRKKIAKEIRKGLKEFLKAWRKGEVKVVEKTMSVEEMIISQAKSVIELKNKFEVLEDKVNNRMTIESGEQTSLQFKIKARVYERFDTYDKEELKKEIVKLLFSNIHKELKKKFGVPSYKDVKVKDFEDCLNFVKVWREDQSVREKINEL